MDPDFTTFPEEFLMEYVMPVALLEFTLMLKAFP